MSDNSTSKAPKLRTIALEEHFGHPAALKKTPAGNVDFDALSESEGVPADVMKMAWGLLTDFEQTRLAEMDAHGIDMSILSLTTPGAQGMTDPAAAISTAREINDFLAEQVARHPSRFAGFATLALQDPKAAATEFERCVHKLGFKGAMINGYTSTPDGGGRYLDDPSFLEFWECAADLGAPIYLHPRPALPPVPAYDGHPEFGTGAARAYGVETANHTLRLIFSGLFDQFPGLTLILGHLGELLPYTLWRTQYIFERLPYGKKTDKTLAEYFADNIYITTSGAFSDQTLISALLFVGSDRILFSVDYPYAEMKHATEWLERAPISVSDRRKIAHGNAQRLFGL
ncbi:amidohydrolase family protein [Nocardia sp. NPDC051321]|uniref:amidohydrolase family protein n=1 Tax=Nocardia sp. NPDC051321 TaxID=3364323 RepID=UPI00379016D8